MEEHRFNLMLRRAAEPTTRRAALAALMSGVSLLRELHSSDATKKAKRRKIRRRRQRKAQAASLVKPISFEVVNLTANPITVEYGDSYPLKCCHVMKSLTLQSGPSGLLNTTNNRGFLWIAGKYWIGVFNPPIYLPQVTVAVGGQPPNDRFFCCRTDGTVVLNAIEMSEGGYREFTIENQRFVLIRDGETNYKVYKIILPATL